MSGKNDNSSRLIINGKEYKYWHGFFVEVGPNDYVIPDEFVDLRDAASFAEGCSNFANDRGVGWRTWWTLLYDDVHHKLLDLRSDFTGHQLQLENRHIFTGLSRVEYVDQGGNPEELRDPWKWMLLRSELQLCRAMGSLHGVANYSNAEHNFMSWWVGG